MNDVEKVNALLRENRSNFSPIVDFNAETEKVIELDFTANNKNLTSEIINNSASFCSYIDAVLEKENAKFGIGGYFETRTVYARSNHFDSAEGEARRLHLGLDIWGKVGTPIYAFMNGVVHSFAFNNCFGDYGATIILQHEINGTTFYSLYGHLSFKNIHGLAKGQKIEKGSSFCNFGALEDNGNWPPHLHFQLMTSMENKEGDYPGVAKFSEKDSYLQKIPNPNLILNWI